jgi:hypothetical protein
MIEDKKAWAGTGKEFMRMNFPLVESGKTLVVDGRVVMTLAAKIEFLKRKKGGGTVSIKDFYADYAGLLVPFSEEPET